MHEVNTKQQYNIINNINKQTCDARQRSDNSKLRKTTSRIGLEKCKIGLPPGNCIQNKYNAKGWDMKGTYSFKKTF